MNKKTELLTALFRLYSNGGLTSVFDKRTNKMVNSPELDSIMSDVKHLVPEELSGAQAAKAMRDLDEDARLASIKATSKVVDARKEFLQKMSANGGALGLTKQLVEAIRNGDTSETMKITSDMFELVNSGE